MLQVENMKLLVESTIPYWLGFVEEHDFFIVTVKRTSNDDH